MKLAGLITRLTAALLVASVGVATAQTADDIVEKHLAAMGGREALGRIRTRVSTGQPGHRRNAHQDVLKDFERREHPGLELNNR